MSWTADGSALADHTTFIRVLNEGSTDRAGDNWVIPYRYGEYSNPDKFYTGSDLLVEMGIIHDSAHTHLAALNGIFGKTTSHVTLKRTDHPAGTVQADVELTAAPRQSQDRFTYVFQLRRVDGVWEDASVTTASGTAPSITTQGDQPIGDPVITFSAPGTATLVTGWGTCVMGWAGTGTAIVDCGARTIVKGGAAQDANFTVSQPWWFRFAAKTTVNLTSTVSVTVDYRNKHA
jgi:hypothetical protein